MFESLAAGHDHKLLERRRTVLGVERHLSRYRCYDRRPLSPTPANRNATAKQARGERKKDEKFEVPFHKTLGDA